jgi:MoaA/NifB/PqqE/SkfB family radical SAM enzyme
MLNRLFRRFVPASLYGGKTAYPVLSVLDEELKRCRQSDTALRAVEESKKELYNLLLERFPPAIAKALTLKSLNICLAKYHFHARSTIVPSRPFGLLVDPSNMCQLECPGCVHSPGPKEQGLFHWPNGILSEDRFLKMLKLYGPTAIGVNFFNYGEPLLNRNTPRFIRQARSFLLRTSVSTNLSIRRFDPEAYVESGLDFMLLSIDGATQPVYEHFRRKGNLELVLDNVYKLVEARRKMRSCLPLLSWNFLAFEHNAHEIPQARRLARKIGVDEFRVSIPFGVDWDEPGIRPAAVKPSVQRFDPLFLLKLFVYRNAKPTSVDTETIEGAFERPWNGDGTRDAGPSLGHTCHWLYKNSVMDATGRIMPCCTSPALDKNLVFGTIEGSGRDPFNTESYREARSFFSTRTNLSVGSPYCTQCELDHTAVAIGETEIRQYFRSADRVFFDRQSLSVLSDW